MALPRPITWDEVFYQRNVELGIDPYFHECTSHTARIRDYVAVGRDGFKLMHRWVYWKATGESPEVVMHKCDNPCCININHLQAGTQTDNCRDRDSKARFVASHGRAGSGRFSDFEILEMRELGSKGFTIDQLAVRYDVSRSMVGFILQGKYYRDVR